MERSTHSLNGAIEYHWDDVNNRTDTGYSIGSPGDDSYKLNQYLATPQDVRSYDANGNTTVIGSATMVYDYRNRMSEYHNGSAQVEYKYDALGRRIARIAGSGETRYLHFGSRIVEERGSSGTTQATYVYGRYIDETLTMRLTGEDYYYHTDDQYNVMAITNATGTVVETCDYGDFGQPTGAGSIGNPYLFNGRRYDPETGFYEYRTRYLDPQTGRFTTPDTIGLWGDPSNLGNAYTYVANNPWTFVDPWGLEETGPESGLWDRTCECALTAWNSIGSALCGFQNWRPIQSIKEPISRFSNDLGNTLLSPFSLENQAMRAQMPGEYFKANPSTSDAAERNKIANYIGDIFEENANDYIKYAGIGAGIKILYECHGALKHAKDATLPIQNHHFATNKYYTGKAYTPEMRRIAEKFGLDLNGDWNKELLPHLGRHPDKYHEFVLTGLENAANEAKNQQEFFVLYEKYVKEPIRNNPNLLNKSGWKQ